MTNNKKNPVIDKVIYNFKGTPSHHIDVVPIATRLLTNINKDRTTAPHRTNFYRIIWFQQGNPSHIVDFEKIKIKSPALLFVHKDRIHKFDKDTLHDGKVMIFTDNFFLRSESDRKFLRTAKIFNETEPTVLLTAVNDKLTVLFTQIEQEILNKDQPFITDVLYHLLNTFLYTSERLASAEFPRQFSSSAPALLVNTFIELLENNFKERFSMEKYASLLNLTVNKLNLSILEVKGKTGKQLITERLLLEAKRLLAYSEFNVKEIGSQLGFVEPTNFIKFFHKNVKITPLDFQKSVH